MKIKVGDQLQFVGVFGAARRQVIRMIVAVTKLPVFINTDPDKSVTFFEFDAGNTSRMYTRYFRNEDELECWCMYKVMITHVDFAYG